MSVLKADEAAIGEAARRLYAGALVAFPTETVYGLGADAGSESAVAAIYALKGRPADHPLIVHVADRAQAEWWAAFNDDARRLADAFWPGPLTLVLRRRDDAPAWACGGLPTIGLRCPDHPVALALLQAFQRLGGHGIAGPSANRFGKVSPTTAWHVIDDLGDDAPLVLDGGACGVGVESTIVDCSRDVPALLRPGGVAAADVEDVLGRSLAAPDAAAPRVSGSLPAHYAPSTPVELVHVARLESRLAELGDGAQVAAWCRSRPSAAALAHWQPFPGDPRQAARTLFETLRTLDRRGFARLLIEAPPDDAGWDAVRDRLRRAAHAFSG